MGTHGPEILKPPMRGASAVTLHYSKAQDPVQNTIPPPPPAHRPFINMLLTKCNMSK